MQIPCRECDLVIYLHGEGLLAVQCDRHPFVAKQLVALGLCLIQDGDHEKTFVFPIELFEKVAAIVKPRKRRVLSEEQREVLRARLIPYSFARTPQPKSADAS